MKGKKMQLEFLKEAEGKAAKVERGEGWIMLQGDCLELMKFIPKYSIDNVIVDPPYGTIENLGAVMTKKTSAKNVDTSWDILLPTQELMDTFGRIMKPNGSAVIFSQGALTNELRTGVFCRMLFRHRLIWKKDGFSNPLGVKRAPRVYTEDISVFRMYSQAKQHKQLGTATTFNIPGGWTHVPDVLEFKRATGVGHFTSKPIPLMETLVDIYTNPGEVVLDSTAGSGSTGVAAINRGRLFIGIEKNPEFFALSVKRLREAESALNSGEVKGE